MKASGVRVIAASRIRRPLDVASTTSSSGATPARDRPSANGIVR